MLTIFTPTYNRVHTLERLYNSLLKQDYKNFEWLIIDDGSTDDTSKLIKKLKDEKKIKIVYKYKVNGGKMSAINMAHEIAKGDIFLTIDSDDYLKSNVLSKIVKDMNEIEDNNLIAGIVYNCAYQHKKSEIVAKNMPKKGTMCTYKELDIKYKVVGDKATVWKTEILKKYFYPIIEGEKFIPDAYLMNEISKKYNILVNGKILTYVYYYDDGLTNNYFELVKKNPLGNRLYFRQLYEFEKSLYNVYGYILFSLYGKINFKTIINEHPAKFLCILMYVPIWFVSKIKR